MENAFLILIAIAAIILIVGLLKKVLWLCVVALVIGGGLFITQPEVMDEVSSYVSSFFGGGVSPFEDDDYSDLIDDDVEKIPNRDYGSIGEDDGT